MNWFCLNYIYVAIAGFVAAALFSSSPAFGMLLGLGFGFILIAILKFWQDNSSKFKD